MDIKAAFEAFLSGSWQAVELIKIESGTMSLHFMDNHHMTMEKGLFSDVRIRSRKATLSDCSYFLRPGIDICVLSASQCSDNSDEFSDDHVWIDAKINSIQRKPHNSECLCQYYVNFYVNQGSLGTEIRTLSKEIKVVGINEIAILQKLERNSCENQHYRWESSEDSSTVLHTKLLLGKFLSDLSWLVVTSVIKNVSFCARSVENKIVYQILGSDATSSSLNIGSHISVVNFKMDKEGTLRPVVSQVDVSDTNRSDHAHDSHYDEVSPSYDVEGLRRSKRRNIQPERYFGCGNISEIKVGNVRTWPYKLNKRRDDDDDEEPLPLAQVSGLQENYIEEDVDNSQKVNEVSSCRAIIVYRRRNKTKEVKSVDEANQNEHKTQLASVPLLEEGDSLTLEHRPLNDKVTRSKAHYSTPKLKRKGLFGLEDDVDFDPGREGINSNKGVREKRHRSWYSRSRSHDAEQAYKERRLNAADYKEMIDSYLKDINGTPTKEEPPITNQWKEESNLGQKKEAEIPQREDDEQMSEMDMLWREMEMALTSSYLEETKGSNGANFAETTEESNHTCQHDYRLYEEIGIYCYKCGFVKTEIKYVMPPFMKVQHPARHQEEKQCNGEESKPKADKDDDFHLFSIHASRDNIAKKIDSSIGKERMKGLNMLREITNGFIDVHESGNFESVPGLQIYTLLMNTTDMQREILLQLQTKMAECNGYPLELELLVTLGSIHPWLVKTATCANKFFTLELLKQLEKSKFDVKIGSKVKFILSLVFRVMEKEKVLVFCHNLAPMKLLVELFEMFFKWEKDREILSLNGELELFERGKVIDKFEDPGGVSKVLFASITACAEGISLTAASRVVFLDSEWNPSKTKQAIARAFRPGQQKMVYVYQLLATGTLEEDKYRRTTWKEWVSSMIFSEAFEENPSHSQAEKIEDDVLREMVEEDKSKSIHMILKNEKASTN
ncbi:SNF2 domain-containing protein CLASSY 1 [Spatholobus suberectus]|nr:SNF2 domain-containing protein CLASSY 1 [Spatholobus suberectus]